MSVTLPGTGTVVETVAGTGGDARQVVAVAAMPAVALDSTALAALAAAATPGTQPVSMASAPLPTGAASAAGQGAIIDAILAAAGATQPVAAASLPLPTGAATAAGVAAIVTALGTPAQAGATQAMSAATLPLPTGAATQTTSAALLASTGAAADTAATTDGGTFSLIALIKRLVGKLPSALGAQTSALSLGVVLASDQSLILVNTLAVPGVARKLAAAIAGGASANVALTTSVRRISMVATGSALRYVIGTGSQTASSASHYIQLGERLDLAVPASAQIAVLSDTATAGSLEISELS